MTGLHLHALLLLLLPAAPPQAVSPPQADSDSARLRRRADWSAAIAPMGGDSGAMVHRVTAGSAAATAGLRRGDRIVRLNGTPVRDPDTFWPAFTAVRGTDSVRVEVVRHDAGRGDTLQLRFVVDSVPHERIAGVRVTYAAVRSERGALLRTVVTRPARGGAAGGGAARAGTRLPAILFIPWLSCDPIEKPEPRNDGFVRTLQDVAAGSGLVFMRVEKPGVGDSEGDCRQGGLAEELAGYRAGLRALRTLPDVDTARIFVMGGSLGGALAPVLAAEMGNGVAGVVAVNGFTKTWYEHMLEIERRRLQLSSLAPTEVNAAMRGFARFYTEYLLGQKTPAEVLAAHPALGPLWYDEPGHQYGRPAAYYHAVNQLDVEHAWTALAERGVPALVLWGEYDWIMSRDDQVRAVGIVNSRRPGSATLVVLPKTDHGLMRYATLADAFSGTEPAYDGAAARVINRWLRERTRGGAARTAARGTAAPEATGQ